MSFCWLLQNSTIRAMHVQSRPSSDTPMGPDSSLAAPSLLPMSTSVIRRPRVTFGPSPQSSPPIDLTASSALSHSPIPFDTSLHPSSSSSISSSSSSSFPLSSSFYSATIPAVSGPLVSASRASPSAIFSSNPPLDPPPSSPPPSSPQSSQFSFHSHPIDASLSLRLPPLPVLRSSSNPSVACPTCQVDFESDSGSKAKYMVHLRKRHSSDVSLVSLQIPALDSPLIRCNRCHWICSGQAGLIKHQAAKNQSCRRLVPSSSASLISSPTVLSPPLSDGSPSL